MRPLGRKERQRHNLLCPASPAECCRERRGLPSGPFRNFSIGRHLCFGPTRSLHPRGVLGQPECSRDRTTIFACHFLLAVFLATNPRRCSPVAKVKRESVSGSG